MRAWSRLDGYIHAYLHRPPDRSNPPICLNRCLASEFLRRGIRVAAVTDIPPRRLIPLIWIDPNSSSKKRQCRCGPGVRILGDRCLRATV